MKYKQNGSVVQHKGYWVYVAKFPGDKTRKMRTLRAPGAKHGLSADRPRAMAEQAAQRLWEDATRSARKDNKGATVEAVCAAYCAHAAIYYRTDDGKKTSEVANVTTGVRLFRQMFATAAVAELTHADMLTFRDALIRSGVARVTVNRRLGIVKRMMAWALDEALISATVKAELSQVQMLKRGRSAAPERPPVREVPDDVFDATIAAMLPNTADLCRVHRLTGMRPDEICGLRWSCIDTSRVPWVYRPNNHKNDWRGDYGQPRPILIGPRARAILDRHRDAEFPFSPAAAVREWQAAKRAVATSPSRVCRADPHAVRVPGERWQTDSYTGTIAAACRRAGVAPWSANRLRHSFATDVRRVFGLEACRAVLGHSNGARITDRYSFAAMEDETIKAATPAVEALG
jgi:integrase